MKKSVVSKNLIFISMSIILLSSAFVSAGWLSDLFGFTGRVVDNDIDAVIGNYCEPMLGNAMCQGVTTSKDYHCKDLGKGEGKCVECLEDSHCGMNETCVDDECVVEKEEENETLVTVITKEGDYKAREGSVIKMNGLEVKITEIYWSSSVNVPSYVSFQSEMNAYIYDIKEGESDKIAYGSATHPLSYNLQLYVHSVNQNEIILGVYEINEPINYTEENETSEGEDYGSDLFFSVFYNF